MRLRRKERQRARRWAGPLGLLCAFALFAVPASQAQAFNLRDVLFGSKSGDAQPAEPPVGRYVDENGAKAFVLDRSSSVVLLRFEDSPEVWVLTPEPGPGGDIIYRNDMGDPVLRLTRFGGLTLFSDDHPDGAAAALVGEAQAIRLAAMPPNVLIMRLSQASLRVSHALQRLVAFNATDVTPQTASLIGDAAGVAAEAIADLAQRPDGRRAMARLNKVNLAPGRKAAVQYNTGSGVLQIAVVEPHDGAPPRDELAGRPSSRRITAAFTH